VKITDYLVPGKTTIFDFTSEFCPPAARLRHTWTNCMRGATTSWSSKWTSTGRHPGHRLAIAVAKQYSMHSIPHFKVFGPDGKLMAEGDKARTLVTGWFK